MQGEGKCCERLGLDDRDAWTGNLCQKHAFATEQQIPDAALESDFVCAGFGEPDQVTGADRQCFAVFLDALCQGAAGTEESKSISFQFLKDQSFTAKQSGGEAFGHGDTEIDAPALQRLGTALTEEHAVIPGHINSLDLARHWRRETYGLRCLGFVGEEGCEEGFAGQFAEQTAHERSGHFRRHDDPGLHHHQGAGLGLNGLAEIEPDRQQR